MTCEVPNFPEDGSISRAEVLKIFMDTLYVRHITFRTFFFLGFLLRDFKLK